MDLTSLIFPAPESSYDEKVFDKDLIYIPRINSDGEISNNEAIPCLLLPYSQGSSKLMIYFHGNAEDLGQAYGLLNHLRNTLKIHLLAVEYQGYGIYPGHPTAK